MKGLSSRRISWIDPNDPIWFRWFREAGLNLEFRSRFEKSRLPFQEVTTTEKFANKSPVRKTNYPSLLDDILLQTEFSYKLQSNIDQAHLSYKASSICQAYLSYEESLPACILMKCNLHKLSFSVITVIFLAEIGEILWMASNRSVL